MFKLWSETNQDAKKELKPDFGFRKWVDLQSDEKGRIWKYLEKHFFNPNLHHNYNHPDANESGKYFVFYGDGDYDGERREDIHKKQQRILLVISGLNDRFKAKSYARDYLETSSFNSACNDFFNIFTNESENVVFELLSMYAKAVIFERREENLRKQQEESEDNFTKRNTEWKLIEFDKFAEELNDIFQQFGIYVFLTRLGFVPRQSEKIIKDIYIPVLDFFGSDEYKEVNMVLKKAFINFQEKQYDKVISNAINAIQAYLQLKINKKIGNGNLKMLLSEAQAQKIIPSDRLANDLYGNIESFFARIRHDKTDAHPSIEKATEGDALFVLNLTMVMLQNFVNYKK